MAADALPLIDVDRLQLGMYVVLDVGWRHHPFAFSSFSIRSNEQLAQLRTFGPKQIRYCPQRSSVPPLPETVTAAVANDSVVAAPAAPDMPAETAAPATVAPPPLQPRASASPASEGQLHRIEASLRKVEAEYRQATTQHQLMLKHILFEPPKARQFAEHLGDTLVRLVAEGRDMAVRLLTERVDGRASGHEVATTALALLLARDCEFSPEEMRALALAGVLHDIGKIKIPSFLHEDRGQLDPFEQQTYRRHVELGVEMVSNLGLADSVVRAVGEHHEHVDGSGFPKGRRGELLSPIGRVLAIANRYQNLVCPADVDAGLSPHVALKLMFGPERAQFDPVFLPRFVRILGIYPPGTVVELSNRQTAVVISSRPGMSLAPRVQLLGGSDLDESATVIDLDPVKGLGVRCSPASDHLHPAWAKRARQWARAPFFVEPFQPQSAQSARA